MTKPAALDGLFPRAAVFWLLLLTVFSANIANSFLSYKKLTEFEYSTVNAKLVSSKERKGKNGELYFSLFFSGDGFDFRAYSKSDMKTKEGDYFALILKTKGLSFLDFFKTPRLKIESMEPLNKSDEIQKNFKEFIANQHEMPQIKELYLNLFLNAEVGEEVESFINGYGLGAFFAISGLNVALLVAFIFFIVSPLFRFFQDRFFPYTNRNFWIFLLCFAVLLFYAYLTDFTPSFIRAVVAAILVFYLALGGDDILGYKTLILTTLLCLAIFPSFLFSIGFWLSLYGVFLIFLFLANTDFKHKFVVYFALSSWLFFAMLPIIHYIFGVFTKAHLLNSLFGAIFDIFYPLSLTAHLATLGWIFDSLLAGFVQSAHDLTRNEFLTPLWFFISYVVLSFAAVFEKRIFFAFNVAMYAYFVAAMVFLSIS